MIYDSDLVLAEMLNVIFFLYVKRRINKEPSFCRLVMIRHLGLCSFSSFILNDTDLPCAPELKLD